MKIGDLVYLTKNIECNNRLFPKGCWGKIVRKYESSPYFIVEIPTLEIPKVVTCLPDDLVQMTPTSSMTLMCDDKHTSERIVKMFGAFTQPKKKNKKKKNG